MCLIHVRSPPTSYTLSLHDARPIWEELAILERDLTPLQNAAEKPIVRMTYTEAVEQLKSDQTSSLLEEMEESRRLEMEEMKTEREALKKEHGSAKKWRKTQIDQQLREIGTRLDH